MCKPTLLGLNAAWAVSNM